MEPGLEQNLTALTNFDYSTYEIFFAVSSMEDPAYPLLKRIAAASKRAVHVVVAGRTGSCGEKVNNLCAAVGKAGDAFDVLVFADSDGRPPRRWLARLVAPLADAQLGAATTFRWLMPGGGFWSALASAWNAPLATYLGEHGHNFCWGGGTALRRERFEQIGGLAAWTGSVSDDFSLTAAIVALRLLLSLLSPNAWCRLASPPGCAQLLRVRQSPVHHHPDPRPENLVARPARPPFV